MKKFITIIILSLIGYSANSQEHVVHFEFDKYDIDKQQVSDLKDKIKSTEIAKIFLYGYTDTVGTFQYNEALAEKRIEAVKNLINNNLKSNIEIHSTNYGEKNSVSPLDKENRKVVIKYEVEKYSLIEPTYNSSEIFQINNSNDTVIKCNQGTEIYIPKNSFVLINDNPLTSEYIEFRVTEYYSPIDMIAANLTTQSNDEILETGGMIYLEAFSENSKCKIKKGKILGLKFKEITSKDSMQIFYGEPIDNGINWVLESNDSIEIIEEEVFLVVENMPTFNGGDISAFRSYVYENLKYPAIAIEKEIQGSVFVQFTIDISGSIINPKIIKGADPSLAFEVLRVINSSPPWIPGMQRGRPVKVLQSMRINFVLDNNFPIDENNRITSYSDFDNYVVSDSTRQKQIETVEYIKEFYLWTKNLEWINCDKFYRNQSTVDIKIKVNSNFENIYSIFNRNRSIMSTDIYDPNLKIKGFKNLPSNQKVLFIGIKVVNGLTYFTSFNVKPNGQIIEPDYDQIDKDKLKEELKKIGL